MSKPFTPSLTGLSPAKNLLVDPSCYDYRNGVVYEPVSPIFERPCESVLEGWQRRRTGIFVHGEIREFEPIKRRKGWQ